MLTYDEIEALCKKAYLCVKKYEVYPSKLEDDDLLQQARLGAYTAVKYSQKPGVKIKNLSGYIYSFARGYILHSLSGKSKRFNNSTIAIEPYLLDTFISSDISLSNSEDQQLWELASQISSADVNNYIKGKPLKNESSAQIIEQIKCLGNCY